MVASVLIAVDMAVLKDTVVDVTETMTGLECLEGVLEAVVLDRTVVLDVTSTVLVGFGN